MNSYYGKVIILSVLAASTYVSIFELENVYGQQSNLTNASAGTNFTKLFQDKYTTAHTNPAVLEVFGNNSATFVVQDVIVRHESPTTILISGDLINSVDNVFNSYLWQAMDMLNGQYGFKLQQVMTSGEGSKGNPTVVYILMTK